MRKNDNGLIRLENGLLFKNGFRYNTFAIEFLKREIFKSVRYYKKGFEIRNRDVVVDIGANMGLFALWACTQNPGGKIYAVEPTSVISSLEESIRLNGINNVHIIKAAIGEDGGMQEMVIYPGFNLISHNSQWSPAKITLVALRILSTLFGGRELLQPTTEKVPTKTLDRIIEDHQIAKIDLLKVDCEGAEYGMFKSLSKDNFKMIDKIVMEFHEYDKAQDHRELISILNRHGFKTKTNKNLIEYRFLKYGVIWAHK